MFRAIISPIVMSTRLCLQLVVKTTDYAACWWPRWPLHPGHQQAPSSVLFTTSCKHSPVFLRMGEIIGRNMLSWLKLLIKLLMLHLVGCLYYCQKKDLFLTQQIKWWKHVNYKLTCKRSMPQRYLTCFCRDISRFIEVTK